MFKVECPGCNAPYQVDERRVPAAGLKMRCPKCGVSFQVDPPADIRSGVTSPVLGAALGASAAMKGPPRPPRRGHKATMLGVAGPAGSAKGPPRPARPAPPSQGDGPPSLPLLPVVGGPPAPAARAPAAQQSSLSDLDLDLPSVAGPGPPAGPGASGSPSTEPTSRAADAGPAEQGKSAAQQAVPGDLDLPALDDLAPASSPGLPSPAGPGGTKAGLGELDMDLDLSAVPRTSSGAAAPVGPASPPVDTGIDFELDLPAPVPAAGRQPPAPQADLAPPTANSAAAGPAAQFGLPALSAEVDLPSPTRQPAAATPPAELDLPSPGGGAELPSVADRTDLPSVGGGADLPSVGGGADLPAAGGAIGLPSVGGVDLPSVGDGVQLPSPQDRSAGDAGIDLLPQTDALSGTVPGMPAPADAGPLGAVGLGAAMATGAAAEPSSQDAFGELELPTLGEHPPAAPAIDQSAAPQGDSLAVGPGEQPAVVDPAAGAAVKRQSGGGGTDYGEVSLDAAAGELALEAEVPEQAPVTDDDMEFGAIPQEDEPRPGAGAVAPAPPVPQPAFAATAMARGPRPAEAPRATRRWFKVLVGAVVMVAVGGGALALLPSVGPFGIYFIESLVKGSEYRVLVRQTAEQSRKRLAVDVYPQAQRALTEVERASADAKRVKALSAYSAYVAYLTELRFGQDPKVRARAKVVLDELQDEQEVENLKLASAAREAVSGRLARSRQAVDTLLRRSPRDIDVLVLRGEVELRAREGKRAVKAWEAALEVEKSARSCFGLARALHASGDRKGAEKQAKQALKLSPGHVGARILLARLEWEARGGEQSAKQLLEQAKKTGNASPAEVVELQTLLGDIHLARSRISHAEAAYAEALKISPKAAGALRGLGETLYRAGRYTEALARFEAGAQADPDDVSVKVGVAKLLLALERLQDARTMLVKLRDSHPKSIEVAYWEGRAWEAVGDRKQAEAAYRRAIKHGQADPAAVEAYVALAMLLNQKGQADDARSTLDQARQQLPDSPVIHKALGELALKQGRVEQALAEYRAALELDREDVGARFWLGVALRRNRQFDEAQRAFDAVTEIDRDYPGLALERGLLFEESGRSEEALQAYEAALSKAPNDPDLMLRVGCGQVTAGRSERAVQLLRKVLASRPQSAETNHCLGRALLLEKNLAEALKKLERSVQLDPHRAEYHLYVGWAANEAGDSLKAQRALKRALELDQGLADAYWQRGILAYRQGRVKDAVSDLRRALDLKPSRFEAHAGLAEAYDDLGMEAQALGEWREAIRSQPDNPVWRFRFGKLLSANNNREAAQVQLTKALELIEKQKSKPRWEWQAHLMLARSVGVRPEAAEHWEAYLRAAPLDDPYREEAMTALRKMGKPWDGN